MSAIQVQGGEVDLILTDPPYYDAIPYSDLMDFFYVWVRRGLLGTSPDFDTTFGILQSVGDHFLSAYIPILEKRKDTPYGERERDFQLYRRGR